MSDTHIRGGIPQPADKMANFRQTHSDFETKERMAFWCAFYGYPDIAELQTRIVETETKLARAERFEAEFHSLYGIVKTLACNADEKGEKGNQYWRGASFAFERVRVLIRQILDSDGGNEG